MTHKKIRLTITRADEDPKDPGSPYVAEFVNTMISPAAAHDLYAALCEGCVWFQLECEDNTKKVFKAERGASSLVCNTTLGFGDKDCNDIDGSPYQPCHESVIAALREMAEGSR